MFEAAVRARLNLRDAILAGGPETLRICGHWRSPEISAEEMRLLWMHPYIMWESWKQQ